MYAFDYLQGVHELAPSVLPAFPLLASLHARVGARPRVAAYLASPRRHGLPNADYVREVNTVLGR